MSATVAGVVAVAWLVIVNVVTYFLNENSHGAKSWWSKRSRTTFFTTNRSALIDFNQRPERFYAFDLHDANHLVECSVLGRRLGGVALLLLYRILAAIYFAATLLIIEYNGDGLEAKFLAFFTNWTFILLGIYSVLGVLSGIRHLWRGRSEASREYDLWDKLFALSLVTASACAVFLTAFYWKVIYDPEKDTVQLDNVLRHGGNIVVLWGDYILSRAPVCGYWFHFILGYTSVYAVFMWVYAAVGSGWLYDALDFEADGSAAYYIVLPILVYIGFILTYLLAGLREFAVRCKCCCMCCPRACCCCKICREDSVDNVSELEMQRKSLEEQQEKGELQAPTCLVISPRLPGPPAVI